MIYTPAVHPLAPRTPEAWYFAFFEGELLFPDDEGTPLAPQAVPLEAGTAAPHYLGRIDGVDAWALAADHVPPGWRAVSLRAAMMALGDPLMGIAGRAVQVLEWDRTHRYCGHCATPTEPRTDERSRICPNCGLVVYPRVSPAMMALVWRGKELLLARSPRFAKGMYSALAGFVEAGETLEECVAREVAEEVGVQVKNLRYFGSQSWPFPHSLMVAYTAEWAGGEIVPQEGEIEEAGWYPIDALPGIPPRFSIAGHLIRDTVEAMRRG
jgi:NAD+ diphosphatase